MEVEYTGLRRSTRVVAAIDRFTYKQVEPTADKNSWKTKLRDLMLADNDGQDLAQQKQTAQTLIKQKYVGLVQKSKFLLSKVEFVQQYAESTKWWINRNSPQGDCRILNETFCRNVDALVVSPEFTRISFFYDEFQSFTADVDFEMFVDVACAHLNINTLINYAKIVAQKVFPLVAQARGLVDPMNLCARLEDTTMTTQELNKIEELLNGLNFDFSSGGALKKKSSSKKAPSKAKSSKPAKTNKSKPKTTSKK